MEILKTLKFLSLLIMLLIILLVIYYSTYNKHYKNEYFTTIPGLAQSNILAQNNFKAAEKLDEIMQDALDETRQIGKEVRNDFYNKRSRIRLIRRDLKNISGNIRKKANSYANVRQKISEASTQL